MCLVRVFQLLVATDTKSRMLCTSETRITTETASPMTTAPFTLRPAAAADLEEWGRVAGLAFAFKGGDPGRFLKNHTADGEAEDSDIHVRARARASGFPPTCSYLLFFSISAGVQRRRHRGCGTCAWASRWNPRRFLAHWCHSPFLAPRRFGCFGNAYISMALLW